MDWKTSGLHGKTAVWSVDLGSGSWLISWWSLSPGEVLMKNPGWEDLADGWQIIGYPFNIVWCERSLKNPSGIWSWTPLPQFVRFIIWILVDYVDYEIEWLLMALAMDCPLLGSSNLHSIHVKHTAEARKRCTETTIYQLTQRLLHHCGWNCMCIHKITQTS